MRRLAGMAPWQRTLSIVLISQIASAAGFALIFPFLPLYVETLDSTMGWSVEILSGLVIASQAFTMMLSAPVWGALADRYGRKLMVARATFGGAIILLLMGFVQTAEQLILLRAVQGMVTGTVAAANALVASQTPRERTGFAMGVVQVGLWSGIAAGPILGGLLAEGFGYRMPFVLTSGLLVLSGTLVWFGVQEDFTPKTGNRGGLRGFTGDWGHVLSMNGVPVTFAARFMSGLGRNLVLPIAPLFIASLMSSQTGVSAMTGLITGVSSATGTLGAVVLGRLGDHTGHRPILIGSALGVAVCYLPQTFATATWQLLILQGLAGFAAGGIVAAPSALLAQYTEPGEEGAVFGLDNSVWSGSRALSPVLGSGAAVLLGMRSVFALTALLFVLTAGVGLLLPRRRTSRRLDAETA